MADATTTYLGIPLRNPIIVGSSGLTNSVEKIVRCEEVGAGAVVLKSLFEEQIYVERIQKAENGLPAIYHPEALDYIRQIGMNFGPDDYLSLIRSAKKTVKIPVIASLNCISEEWWADYAVRIQKAGADALELNVSFISHDPDDASDEIEERVLAIVRAVIQAVSLPIAVKIGPYFTNVARLVKKIQQKGAAGVVLFNRFYQVDIDADTLELKPGYALTPREDVTIALRWIALLSGRVKISLAGTGGIYSGEDVAKYLLAGADAVEVCSAFYRNRIDHLGVMLNELTEWMKKHQFASLSDFRGLLAQKKSEDPESWERHQYIKALVGLE